MFVGFVWFCVLFFLRQQFWNHPNLNISWGLFQDKHMAQLGCPEKKKILEIQWTHGKQRSKSLNYPILGVQHPSRKPNSFRYKVVPSATQMWQ
jgi:hypothetical protein